MQAKNRFEVKRKIKWFRRKSQRSYSNTGQVPARTSQAKAKLPKLTLPKFRGEFINGTLSGTVFYPPFMTTQKFLKWKNSTTRQLYSSESLRQNAADYHHKTNCLK